MHDKSPMNEDYHKTLLLYFEEEIMGEAYFYGLRAHYKNPHEHNKLTLIAQVERYAAESVRPLIDKYGLTPRSDDDLKTLGESWINIRKEFLWHKFIINIIDYFPKYLDDFAALEAMAPAEDLAALNILTEHEVAVIEFAHLEVKGSPDSVAPMQNYMRK